MGHLGTYITIYVKIDGLRRTGVLKDLEVCDFEKSTWPTCRGDDGSCCEKISEFLIVTFSYIQTKR